jgi:hypothetical protein
MQVIFEHLDSLLLLMVLPLEHGLALITGRPWIPAPDGVLQDHVF